MDKYDQLTDRDDLAVAKEEIEGLMADLADSDDLTDEYGHGLETAISVLGGLIAKLPV